MFHGKGTYDTLVLTLYVGVRTNECGLENYAYMHAIQGFVIRSQVHQTWMLCVCVFCWSYSMLEFSMCKIVFIFFCYGLSKVHLSIYSCCTYKKICIVCEKNERLEKRK